MGWFSGGPAAGETRHPCAGAGRWFPADREDLGAVVSGYLRSGRSGKVEGRVAALIVPHAGYTYCGPVAGEAYRTLQGRKDIRRVVILAFSHSHAVRGISVLNVEAYETPLGDVEVDREAVEMLLKNPLFTTVEEAHAFEHSDENQLPFLQVALGTDFKLVSLFVGRMGSGDFDRAAEAIKPLLDEKTVVVVSSDFTHYGRAYGFAPFRSGEAKDRLRELDGGAIEEICRKDFTGFRDYLETTGATICGVQPISLLLKVLPPNAQGKLLKYETSADVSGGDYSMAVGYGAVVFWVDDKTTATVKSADKQATETKSMEKKPVETKADEKKSAEPAQGNGNGERGVFEGPADHLENLLILTAEERATLLELARQSLAGTFDRTAEIDLLQVELTETLKKPLGAFVTLTIDGELRGCIGYITGRKPLYQAVIDNAFNAAFRDPRFSPLTAKEFRRVHIEISVLSPLEETTPEEVVVGRDGLVISKDERSGVLLPQVPVEYGWTRTEFLDHLCRKAGLPKGSWKSGATLQRFGAQVFGEPE